MNKNNEMNPKCKYICCKEEKKHKRTQSWNGYESLFRQPTSSLYNQSIIRTWLFTCPLTYVITSRTERSNTEFRLFHSHTSFIAKQKLDLFTFPFANNNKPTSGIVEKADQQQCDLIRMSKTNNVALGHPQLLRCAGAYLSLMDMCRAVTSFNSSICSDWNRPGCRRALLVRPHGTAAESKRAGATWSVHQ